MLFKPTNLGVALVEGYDQLGLDLAKPKLRALMETKMTEIEKGKLEKEAFLQEILAMMKNIYV